MVDSFSNSGFRSGLIAPRSADRLPRGIVFDRGFKILGTPLGFGGARKADFIFFSHPDQRIARGTRRVFGHRHAVAALKKRSDMEILPIEYRRPFKLGRMMLTMYPAGAGAGSALLEIAFGDTRIVYVDTLRSCPPLQGESLHHPRCDLVLVDTVRFSPQRTPAPGREKRRFLDWISTANRPMVVCTSKAAALDIASCLTAWPGTTGVSRGLYEFLMTTLPSGAHVKKIGRLDRTSHWDLVVHSRGSFDRLDPLRIDDKTALGVTGDAAESMPGAISFALGQQESLSKVASFVYETHATRVAVGASQSDQLPHMLKRRGLTVHFSRTPTQMVLPL